MRLAVVASAFGEGWREESAIVRRIAAVLGEHAEVEVLVASGGPSEEFDGGLPVRRFLGNEVRPSRAAALRRATLGDEPAALAFCSCIDARTARTAGDVPRSLQEELLRAEGGDAPGLFEHLRTSPYDTVLFCGAATASSYFGMQAMPESRRALVLPLLRRTPLGRLPVVREVLDRADLLLVVTESERAIVMDTLGPGAAAKTRMVGFVLKIGSLAFETEPVGEQAKRHLVFARDWTAPCSYPIVQVAAAVAADFPDVRVLATGRGTQLLPDLPWLEVRPSVGRTDLWRWMARGLAVFDPEPHHLLAREVLEGMLSGAPVLVSEFGGASREHAERGNGGLWFSDYAHLGASIAALSSEEVARGLGEQGRRYALSEYGDPERFADRVTSAVLA